MVKDASRHAYGSVRHKISGPAARARTLECFSDATLDLVHGRVESPVYDAIHERCIVFVDRCYWIVSDWLRAPSVHDYSLNFQLASGAEGDVRIEPDSRLRVDSPGLLIVPAPARDLHLEVVSSWVSSRYGEKARAPAVRLRRSGGDIDFDTVLFPYASHKPMVCVRRIVDAASGMPVLRIDVELAGERFIDHWFHGRSLVASDVRVGPFRFSGRWLHWRTTLDGTLRAVSTHGGARIESTAAVAMALGRTPQ